jgi:hypothetical protein
MTDARTRLSVRSFPFSRNVSPSLRPGRFRRDWGAAVCRRAQLRLERMATLTLPELPLPILLKPRFVTI